MLKTTWLKCSGEGPSARFCLEVEANRRGYRLVSIIRKFNNEPIVRSEKSITEWLCEVEMKEDK